MARLSKLIANLVSVCEPSEIESIFVKNPDYLNVLLTYVKPNDSDNPSIREWCLMTIRTLYLQNDKIKARLEKTQLDIDFEGKKTLEQIGAKEVYEKEMKKLMKQEENKR